MQAATTANVQDSTPCLNIFEYLDYRKYLNDFYQTKKDKNVNFSFRLFSMKAGFKSPNHIKLLIENKRNLSQEGIERLSKACQHSKQEQEFFSALVNWNQAAEGIEKIAYWEALLRCLGKTSTHILNDSELKIFTRWYVLPLMEMIRLKDFQLSAKWITKRFGNKVSIEEIEEIFSLFLKHGLVQPKEGKFELTNKIIYRGGDISSDLIRNYHRTMIPTAIPALEQVAVTHREFNSASFAICEEDVAKLKKDIQEFCGKILEYTSRTVEADNVYQMNIQFYPMTEDVSKVGSSNNE